MNMQQTRQNMTDILLEMQVIQLWAMEHGIHSFQLSVRTYPFEDEGDGPEGLIKEYGDTEERFVDVVIFKTGDDTDEDYLSIDIPQWHSSEWVSEQIQTIKDFIGYV